MPVGTNKKNSCTSKKAYDDYLMANEARCKTMTFPKTPRLFIYRCDHCEKWHLTKMPQKKHKDPLGYIKVNNDVF